MQIISVLLIRTPMPEFLHCWLCFCRSRSTALRSQVCLFGPSGVAASILVSGRFFAVAHRRSLRGILYAGAVLVALMTLTAEVGLIRSR
jgi:hypothetical protein